MSSGIIPTSQDARDHIIAQAVALYALSGIDTFTGQASLVLAGYLARQRRNAAAATIENPTAIAGLIAEVRALILDCPEEADQLAQPLGALARSLKDIEHKAEVLARRGAAHGGGVAP